MMAVLDKLRPAGSAAGCFEAGVEAYEQKRFLKALGHKDEVMIAGHDIGGGVAQHLMLGRTLDVPRVAVVNGVMYDSWPFHNHTHRIDYSTMKT